MRQYALLIDVGDNGYEVINFVKLKSGISLETIIDENGDYDGVFEPETFYSDAVEEIIATYYPGSGNIESSCPVLISKDLLQKE